MSEYYNGRSNERSEVKPPRAATVLQIVPAMNIGGGVERGTVEIADAIVAAGGRSIVASSGGNLVHELVRVGSEHVTLALSSKNPFRIYKNIENLSNLIKDEQVDIVHARSRAPAWSSFFATRRTRTPFITTFHGTYNRGSSIKRLYNSVMTKGDRVIAISSFIGGHVRQHYGIPNDRIRIIHRGVDTERFNPASVSPQRMVALAESWRLTEGYPVVTLPGRLSRWKGQKVFIEAISLLARKDIRCVLLGSDQGRTDYRHEIESMIRKYDLGGVMRLVNECRDMPAAYMLSDVIVSASTDPEAFGRVVAEGQALGRPVIATNHGGPQEIIIEGETGWCIPPGEAQLLANAISKALDLTPDARQKMADRGIKNVQENFSKRLMCSRTLDVYDEVLNVSAGNYENEK